MKKDNNGINYSINDSAKKKEETNGDSNNNKENQDVPDQPQTKLNDGEYQKR